MTTENPTPEESNIEVSIVNTETDPGSSADISTPSEIQQETRALFEAIRKRAQSEVHAAGELSREAYLNAIRQARQVFEQDNLIDSKRIEESVEMLQQEVEKNWQAIVTEIEGIGERLSEAARTAWEKLTQTSKPESTQSEQSKD